jgi:hypothetical protein
MKSANFEILRDGWPELAELGGFAEAYAHPDPDARCESVSNSEESISLNRVLMACICLYKSRSICRPLLRPLQCEIPEYTARVF